MERNINNTNNTTIKSARVTKQNARLKAIAGSLSTPRTAKQTDNPDEALSPEVEERLSEIVTKITSLHRRSTAQVFELGSCLAEAKAVQPEKRFGRWVKDACGYTVRSAWNFISVHERLNPHREKLEEHAVGSTALFALATGNTDQITDVIDQLDAGKRLTVADIKALVAGDKEVSDDVDISEAGGKAGLHELASAKLKSDLQEFHRLTALVLAGVEDGLARVQSGKRMVMRSLANDVELSARHASDLFKDIAAPLEPNSYQPNGNLRHASIGTETGWGAVQHSLYRLGGAGSWPTRDEMEAWVINVAHPALRFAVHGEAYIASVQPIAIAEEVTESVASKVEDGEFVAPTTERAIMEVEAPSLSVDDLDDMLNRVIDHPPAPASAAMR